MRAYDVVQLDEITRSDGWAPIRRELDVQSFGINAWTAAAGDTLIPEHDEVPTGHEELYLVTAGRATFTVQGEVTEAGPGTVVLVRDPAARRGAVAAAAATTVVSVGGRPGEVYAPQAWEVNADLLPLFDRGEFGEAKRVVSAALEYGPWASCSSTWRAPRPSWARPTRPSTTSPPRSRTAPTSPRRRGTTTTWSRSARIRGSPASPARQPSACP